MIFHLSENENRTKRGGGAVNGKGTLVKFKEERKFELKNMTIQRLKSHAIS